MTPKRILNVTEQPVSILFCGRELFHIHLGFFHCLGLNLFYFLLFSSFWILVSVSIIWFSPWTFCSTIWHCPTEICLKADFFLLSFFLHSRLAELGRIELLCFCISQMCLLPDEYIFWLNWKISGQTFCSCAIASALVRLENSRPALDSGSTDQHLCSTGKPNK